MFKVGDKVVCVNNADNEGIITSGKTYTIAYVNDDDGICNIKELPAYDWFLTRFQLVSEVDPLVEIRQSEYTALIEEINLLQELLSEANARNQSIPEPTVFKPVSYYTMSDWEQALAEKWVFKQYDGTIINIIGLDYSDTSYKVETETAWLQLDGTEYDFGSSDSDIVERIK